LYACSEKAAKWLYGNQAQQGVLLKNGIDTDQFIFSKSIRETVRNELNIKEGAITFGHVGRFSHQKNHLFLLDIFAALQKRIPESELVLVGDGPLREDMRKKIQLLNLENKVKLLGVRSDIPRLLQAFDVFLMPSFHEGLPVTLIEAQGAGLPCIISDTITKEVDMGMDLVHFLSLTEKEAWLDAMIRISMETPQRKISATALSRKGYDIKETAASMEGSYMAMMISEEAT